MYAELKREKIYSIQAIWLAGFFITTHFDAENENKWPFTMSLQRRIIAFTLNNNVVCKVIVEVLFRKCASIRILILFSQE